MVKVCLSLLLVLPPFNIKISLSLKHLLHVPIITKNLISVCQFARDNGVFFESHSNYCIVKSQVTNEVLLQGNVGSDGLYRFSDILFLLLLVLLVFLVLKNSLLIHIISLTSPL